MTMMINLNNSRSFCDILAINYPRSHLQVVVSLTGHTAFQLELTEVDFHYIVVWYQDLPATV